MITPFLAHRVSYRASLPIPKCQAFVLGWSDSIFHGVNTCKAATIYSDIAHKSFFYYHILFALGKKSFMLSSSFFIWIQRKRFPIFCFTWRLAWLCWSNKGPFGSRLIQTFAWSSKGTRIPSSLDCSSDWGPTSTQPSICNVKQIFWIVHESLWSSLQTSGRIRLRSSYEDLSRILCIKMHHYLYLESLLGHSAWGGQNGLLAHQTCKILEL